MDRIKEDLNSALNFRKWQEVQDRLAEALGLSIMMVDYMGNSVTDISCRKIEAAKIMLTETDTSIYQIAFNLGFIDPSYFVKQFKRFTGTTPKQYRLNN